MDTIQEERVVADWLWYCNIVCCFLLPFSSWIRQRLVQIPRLHDSIEQLKVFLCVRDGDV